MSTQVTIFGNTGRPVELNYTQQGVPIARFSVASNSVRNTPSGKVEKTDWYNVSAFGRQAETLAKYLNKGAAILVRGRLSLSAWQTREGEPRVNADVVLQDFEFAGGGVMSGGTDTHSDAPAESGSEADEQTRQAAGNEQVEQANSEESEVAPATDPIDDLLNNF